MDELEIIAMADPRRRAFKSDDATLWVWILYGLAQACTTMLMAFDVIKTLTATQVITAVALIVYVAVNELFVRPRRIKPTIVNAPEKKLSVDETDSFEIEHSYEAPEQIA
jgi:membrane protein YdbS with pleckstrin-like domain